MSTYSKNARPQLASTTSQRGALLNLRCPYHAKVMKTLEQTSRRMGVRRDWVRESMTGPGGSARRDGGSGRFQRRTGRFFQSGRGQAAEADGAFDGFAGVMVVLARAGQQSLD